MSKAWIIGLFALAALFFWKKSQSQNTSGSFNGLTWQRGPLGADQFAVPGSQDYGQPG